MKHFKKKTIALILASVITVVGAFGADNYKNSLMSLKFDSTENGDTNITVLTKTNYDAEISPIRKDANTYIIMLPETNSEMQESPTVSGNIQSVNVVTMPYTQSSNGYTKITVKTLSTGLLTAKKAVFLPTHNVPPIPKLPDNTNQPETYDKPTQNLQVNQNPSDTNYQNNENSIENSMRQFQGNNQNVQTNPQINKNKINKTETTEQTTNNNNTSKKSEVDPMERTLLILGSLAVLLGSIFFYMRGRNKLKEVIGEDFEYSLEDDTKQKQQNSPKDLKTTIQNLDKTYNKPHISTINRTAPSMQVKQNANNFSPKNNTAPESVIVDLDQLYIDANNDNDETVENNQDIDLLADFLNDYESQEKEKQLEQELIEQREQETNELYGEDILFSKDDIQKINDLLMAEISDETIENIKRKEVTNPIRPPHATEEDILENFITTLTIKQNISFSRDDVEALRKLISVEIDNNFVTDLRTNPERVKSMQQEIEDKRISPHRVSELLTLNVNDKLPNLTEAVKEQGNKEIESNAQPEVVYYSEGYDVETLTTEDELPDFSKELNNSVDIDYEASEEIKSANDSDATGEFTEIDSLPDLKDVIANPDKYKEPEPEKFVADEETLLKNIENVTFKPFYDETQESEIINNPEEITQTPQIPSKEDIELSEILEENIPAAVTVPNNENIKEEVQTYTFNDKEYTILKTSPLTDGAECHLVKSSDGYSVLGYLGESIFNLKKYDELSPETLQTRLSEKLPEGGERYIVRCGKHKFVLDIKEDKMEFVMDLC